MAGIYSNQKRLIVASEATYGTDQVDVIFGDGATDIIYQDVSAPVLTPNREILEIERARSSQSGTAHQSVARDADFTCVVPMTGREGSGSGEEAPYWSPFLLASGFAETVVSSTSATYTLSTAQSSGMTVYLYHELESGEQRLQRSVGVRGNLDMTLEVGQEAKATFTGKGRYVDFLSDAAQFFNATTKAAALEADGSTAVTARTSGAEKYAEGPIMVVRSATVTVNSNTWCLSGFSFSTNWNLYERLCASASGGTLEEVKLTRAPGSRAGGEFSLDTDSETVIDDFIDQYEQANEIAFSFVLSAGDGSSGSARLTMSASKAQIGAPSMSDQGGLVAFGIPYFLNGDWSDLVADDDITITFDAVS
jgi:hypothetical protein